MFNIFARFIFYAYLCSVKEIINVMSKLRFKNDSDEWVEIEIRPHRRIEITDNDDNRYEIRPDKFRGLNITAAEGSLSIEPHVSNDITIKTI